MKTRKGISILLAILLLPVCAKALIVRDFNDHETGTIQTGDYYDQVNVWDSANVSMTGGEVGLLSSYNSSHINVTGGLVSPGWLAAYNNSIVEISGGIVRTVSLVDSSIMYWSGGNIDGYLAIFDNAVLHVYGKDFLYTPGGGYGFGWLSGHWANGSDFTILFRHLSEVFPPESSVILHVIPEPCTLLLLIFGAAICRRH